MNTKYENRSNKYFMFKRKLILIYSRINIID